MPTVSLRLRPLTRADFPLMADWLGRPHVAQWWDEPRGPDAIEDEYGPCIDGTDPTLVFVCEEAGTPVGFVQIYRMADNPGYVESVGFADAAGIDLFVGDADRRGAGLGPRMISAGVARMWASYPEVHGAVAGPSVANLRSCRAFEKAGFVAVRQVRVPDEKDEELLFFLPRPKGV